MTEISTQNVHRLMPRQTLDRMKDIAGFNSTMSARDVVELGNRIALDQTVRRIILDALEESNDFVSPGELYREAQIAGYTGQQGGLLTIAEEMAKEGIITSRKRGMMQNNWYKLPDQEN